MTTVHVFSDYACPWCYLGLKRLERAVEGAQVQVQVVHFPLAPDVPPEGRDVRAYLESRGVDVQAAWTRLNGLLQAEGLPWRALDGSRSYSTRLAQELACWAIGQPGGERIHAALFHAYQVEQRNLSDVEQLVAVAASIGLDAEQARRVVEQRTERETVDEHWRLAREVGVTGVPTYVADGRGVVGAQEVSTLRRLIAGA